MYKTILVPLDGSSHAEKALAVAVQLARGSDASLCLLTVTEYPPDDIGAYIGGVNVLIPEAEREKLAKEISEKAQKIIDQARNAVELEGLEVREAIRSGHPAEQSIKEAEAQKADAIVMGSRGLGNLRGMVFGSVSQKVSHTAKCSVITVT